MTNKISLRDVHENDLPVFFAQQLEPAATRMAAFPARSHDDFMAHWARIMSDGTTILRTIIAGGSVAGNLVCWDLTGETKVGYWLGQEYWGQGIASRALSQFLMLVKTRPLYAHVAKQNAASIRVLQKCGFAIAGEGTFTDIDGGIGEEYILAVGDHYRE